LVRILDLGIARSGGGGTTRTGDVIGTLNYMSPEQLSGELADRRSDIYSVGALAYELITNQMAFPGTVQTGVLFKILNSGPVPIESLVPGIDPDITAMIERAMAREPDARYPDLEILRQDLAVLRTRLLETASDREPAADANAETRSDSARIASAAQPRPSSPARSAPQQGGRAAAARPSDRVIRPPRRTRRMLLLGLACATLAIALVSTVMLNRSPVSSPPVRTETTAPPPPTASPGAPPRARADQPEGVSLTPLEQQVSAARTTAREQIVAGQRQRALDTLIRGLALDDRDPELNRLIDEQSGVAMRTATEARAAAVVRGAVSKSSAAFRDGQAREREANRLLRAGDRVPGIRAAWAAAALYNQAPEGTSQSASVSPLPAPPARREADTVEPPSTSPQESLTVVPMPVDKPAGAPPPPTAAKGELAAIPRDPASDPRAADLGAVRETLRRYSQAYQSLDGAAVGKMMPSLTAAQLRDLNRDFANYRSYTVEIRNERVDVAGPTATVTCEVVRSFETKNGVAGRNTVGSIFHLRRSASGWTIERLESR